MPTTTDTTPTKDAEAGGAQATSANNTLFCNCHGLPAISVMCGFDEKGLPLGLQIVGPQRSENMILGVVHAFQHATNWHLKQPWALRGAHKRLMKLEMMRKIISHLLPAPRGYYVPG